MVHAEEAPPTNFSISLIDDDGILVSWTPALSAQSSTIYIIYYETTEQSQQVSVSGLATRYSLRGLAFGNKYSISIQTLSDLRSAPIGPREITIGKYSYY